MERSFQINYENTPFLQTSKTGARPNRLNWRCEILLTRNQESIRGKRILDLASHDGRFSYACLKLGASHVTGVEGRLQLVEFARENLTGLGYKTEHFTFIQNDVFDYMHKVKPKQFDTILCFGFLYHTIRQIELLREIKRIRPTYFILDTAVERGVFVNPLRLLFDLRAKLRHFVRIGTTTEKTGEVVSRASVRVKAFFGAKLPGIISNQCLVFRPETHLVEGQTIETIDLGARPTRTLIELLLKSHGFSIEQLYWNKKEIKDWTAIHDYKTGHRVSYIAQPLKVKAGRS